MDMSNILLTNLLSRKEYLNDVLLKKEVALDVSNVTHMARHPIIECRVEITT